MNTPRTGRTWMLVTAICLFGLAVLLLIIWIMPGHACAGCLHPITEIARITSVSRTLPALYLGVGTSTNHQVAFRSWRRFAVGQRVIVSGCLDGSHVDVSRVY